MSHTKDAQYAVDTGGTFTDVVCRDASGVLRVTKLLSSPKDPSDSIERGVRALLAPGSTYALTHGTTVATNALLERRGARTAFVTTAGFEDILALGRQNRPELYALHVHKVPALVTSEDCFGVNERVLASGGVLTPLADEAIDALCETLLGGGYEAVAICLLHAYLNPVHEQILAGRLRARLPDCFITASSEIVRELREYERGSTASVNAYVGPVMARYLARLEGRLKDARRIEIFESSGTQVPIARAARFPVHTALSGPAGGVVGALAAAKQVGLSKIITFDMGGTSSDVALCHGEPSLRELSAIGGLPIQVPTLDIHTVGAGGGSIGSVDMGGALKVGPESAGALPGPACYGRGGQLPTVTDAHVVLGRLLPEHFLGGEMTLDVTASTQVIEALAATLDLGVIELAQGMLDVADAAMSRAIKVISLERGHDPRDFTLVSFGGAGGLHACRLAAQLGMRRVLIPEHPGLLSAYGMLHAERIQRLSRTHLVTLEKLAGEVEAQRALLELVEELEQETRDAIGDTILEGELLESSISCDVRYHGQSFALKVACAVMPRHVSDMDALVRHIEEVFEQEHERLYGWVAKGRRAELVTVRMATQVVQEAVRDVAPEIVGDRAIESSHMASVYFSDGAHEARVFERASCQEGDRFEGPAVVVEYSGTTLIPPGWRVQIRAGGHMLAEREEQEDV